MRVNFYIDNAGGVFTSGRGTSKPVRTYPVEFSRTGRHVTVVLQKNCSVQALLSLINQIRSLQKYDFIVTSDMSGLPPKRYESSEPFCLDLGIACLRLFEAEHKSDFKSELTIWDKTVFAPKQLPFEILNLSQQRLIHLDTPSALGSLPEKLTQHAALYKFSADRHLVLIKLPKTVTIDTTELVGQPELSDVVEEPYLRWLSISGHITMAVGAPLCQQGQLSWQLKGAEMSGRQKFIRLLYPLTSPYERPNNYRLITLTYLPKSKLFIL